MANTPHDPSRPSGRRRGAARRGRAGQRLREAQAGSADPDDVIAALQAEAADLKDRLLRAHAEVENIRKRSEREKEETAKYAITQLRQGHRQRRRQLPARHRRGAGRRRRAGRRPQELPRGRDHDRARAPQRAGALRHQARPADRRAVQPAPASGRHGDPAQRRAGRHRRAGVPGGLHHRGPRPAPGDGGRRQGRPEGRPTGRPAANARAPPHDNGAGHA